MITDQQIVNKLFMMKSKTDLGAIDVDTYNDFPGQRVALSRHFNDNIGVYHTHNFYEINYVFKGSCINLVEETPLLMCEGEFILLHPGTFHTLYSTGDSIIVNFLIRENWFEGLFSGLNFTPSPMSDFIKSTQSKKYFRYILCTKKLDEPSSAALKMFEANSLYNAQKYLTIEAGMIEFLTSLLAEEKHLCLSDSKGEISDISRKLLSYITNNYSDVTLQKVADYAGYSKTHICRLFKSDIGKSFSEALTDIRLSHAQYSLINTDTPIKNIAYSMGYESVEYFQRLFKGKTGFTPGEYRKRFGILVK